MVNNLPLDEDGRYLLEHATLLTPEPYVRCQQEDEDDQKLDDDGRRALLAEARDNNAELTRWKVQDGRL